MKEKIRFLWHELFYKIATPSGVDFAMTCRNVVAHIDLGEPPKTWKEWLRFKLHLSLCQACSYYSRASEALGHAVRELAKGTDVPLDIEKMNRELLQKYGRLSETPKAKK